MLDYAKMQAKADSLHANAKDGSALIDGERYTLTFDCYAGVYVVTDSGGADVVRFNTRKVTECRKWLREYLT